MENATERPLRIAISSHSGCGNTTATHNVGQALGLREVNFTFRDLARVLQIPFEEIQRASAETKAFDFLTDLQLIRASLEPRVVVGSRLSAWLLEADLRVWLNAPLETRAKRIYQREKDKHSSYEAVLYHTLLRDEENRHRYLQVYGIDINDRSNFDIIINTESLTAEQVSSLIVAAAQWASQNRLDRRNLHVERIHSIISEQLGVAPQILRDRSLHFDLKEIYRQLEKRG
jgi:cytidylate kinase